MSNQFYNHSTFPVTGSAATSQSMRAELDLIAAGFDKMPVLTGNANKLVAINGTATGLTIISTSAQLAAAISDETGTGHLVFSDAPTLNNPILVGGSYSPTTLIVPAGTGSTTEGVLQWNTSTDLLLIGTGAATKTLVDLDTAQTFTNKTFNLTSNTLVATSAQLAAAVTDETGTGSLVFATSPALAGTPTAPTAAAGTNTTQLATTAHVFAERSNAFTLTNKTISGSNNTLSNIANSSLTNSSITIGSTNITLGATSTTLAGLSSVTSTSFVGALTGNASTATTLANTRTIWGQNFNGSANVTGALTSVTDITASGTLTSAQLNVLAQGDLRLEDAAGGQYVALQAPATIASSFTLTLPDTAGASGQALITDGSGNLSWSTAASGDVYGPASATDTAVALFDGITGKIIKNSTVTVASDGATVLSVNSSSNGLRITQTGTGNALVVEDSANPDSTPFVIDASGKMTIGHTQAITSLGVSPTAQVLGTGLSSSTYLAACFANDATSAGSLYLNKSRGSLGAVGTIVQSGDNLGGIQFLGDDGTSLIRGATIFAQVDGTPGTNDMPGRLVFSTTADGASSPTERMRIDSAGRVGIGGSGLADSKVVLQGTLPSSGNNTFGYRAFATVPSSSTNTVEIFGSRPTTEAASFTTASISHFSANPQTFGAGSTVTNQYGFNAASSLTGATNNYGFYSNIASGTGRWNFYAAGSAANYFAGNVGIGYADPFNGGSSDTKLQVVGSGATDSSVGIYRFRNDAGAAFINFFKGRGSVGSYTTVNANDGIFNIIGYGADGTSAVPAASIGAFVDGTPGTNDMPGRLVFSTTADGASTSTERMRIDSNGSVGIGAGSLIAGQLFSVNKNPTGATTVMSVRAAGTIQSDVTSQARGFDASQSTVAAAFTLANYYNYYANGVSVGSGSTVTNQFGFASQSAMTGATNNYGFYSNIASGTGRWNFYAAGTAPNYLAGPLYIGYNYYSNTGIGLGYNSGTTNANAIYIDTPVSSATTGTYTANGTYLATAASAFTLSNIRHFSAGQGTFGAGSTVTNQYGFLADGSLTGATNNFGFYSNIASGTGRWNFYAAGTAPNYFSGNVGIGAVPSYKLDVQAANPSNGQIAFFRNQTSNGNGAQIAFDVNNVGSAAIGIPNNTNALAFYVNSSTTERMRIDSAGNVIQTAPTTAPTLSTNGTMVFNLTSNTNLRVSVRGSDGVTRTANITLA